MLICLLGLIFISIGGWLVSAPHVVPKPGEFLKGYEEGYAKAVEKAMGVIGGLMER